MTIGGILGSVVGVQGDEVTLKIDESANVKITVIRSAIQKVLAEGEKPGALDR
jgi:preprotein translocase subunit YajC